MYRVVLRETGEPLGYVRQSTRQWVAYFTITAMLDNYHFNSVGMAFTRQAAAMDLHIQHNRRFDH